MSTEHKPVVLMHNQHGFVSYCEHCKCFRIGFGNICINQTLEDLGQFTDVVNGMYKRYKNRLDKQRRDIYLDTPYTGFSFVFSLVQLDYLHQMLQKTLLLVAARDHIRLQ